MVNLSEVVDLEFGTQGFRLGGTNDNCVCKCGCINTHELDRSGCMLPRKSFVLTRGSEITSKAIFVPQIF